MFFLYFYCYYMIFYIFVCHKKCMSQKTCHPEHQFEYATPAIPDITRRTL